MQEEKIEKEDKIIKYGKKIIALMIFLFIFLLIKNNNSNGEVDLNAFLFNMGIYFIFIEILFSLSNHIQKIRAKSKYINLFLLLILLCILNYTLTKDIDILFIILIVILFWALKFFFPVRIMRLSVAMLFILIPFVILNYHINLYHKITGKIVEKKVKVSAFYGIETAQSECENEMPKKCEFIRWEKVGFSSDYIDCKNEGRSDCVACWDCGYFIVDCFYGCPKSYSE